MNNGESSYRRFLNGDDSAITDIVRDYKDGLILYINSYVKNIYIAEDLCEDTFFRLITKKPKFYGKSSFKSWLYAIGRNVAVDYIRHNSKIISTPIEDMTAYLSDKQNLETAYIKNEQKILLHKSISKLCVEYQTVLWLSYFEGFSNKEISIILKKNDRQITNLLYRAKQALKSILEKEGYVYEKL